ncbi:MAG: InlB B-repeat-containing protein [Candidatus Woesearchaeota archaeon]
MIGIKNRKQLLFIIILVTFILLSNNVFAGTMAKWHQENVAVGATTPELVNAHFIFLATYYSHDTSFICTNGNYEPISDSKCGVYDTPQGGGRTCCQLRCSNSAITNEWSNACSITLPECGTRVKIYNFDETTWYGDWCGSYANIQGSIPSFPSQGGVATWTCYNGLYTTCTAWRQALLTLTKVGGASSGSVTIDPGTNCGTSCTSQTNTYNPSTSVTLTASASSGSTFSGWSGGSCSGSSTTCTVTMNQARSVTATFVQQRTLSLTKVGGASSGSVTIDPGTDCGTSCTSQTNTYTDGTSVILTASASSGYRFVGWSGDGCSGSSTTCTVTMNQARSVTATFQQQCDNNVNNLLSTTPRYYNVGQVADCYQGTNVNQINRGICRKGTRTCQANGEWSSCLGQVLPQVEQCGSGEDESCSGYSDWDTQIWPVTFFPGTIKTSGLLHTRLGIKGDSNCRVSIRGIRFV